MLDRGFSNTIMMVSTNGAQGATLTLGVKFFEVLLRGVNSIISVIIKNGDTSGEGITFEGLFGTNRFCSSEVDLMLDTDVTRHCISEERSPTIFLRGNVSAAKTKDAAGCATFILITENEITGLEFVALEDPFVVQINLLGRTS
jgi:hypothetical protein